MIAAAGSKPFAGASAIDSDLSTFEHIRVPRDQYSGPICRCGGHPDMLVSGRIVPICGSTCDEASSRAEHVAVTISEDNTTKDCRFRAIFERISIGAPNLGLRGRSS